ncbi:MAG TPA: phytoene/squalene synthase family protein [Acetobacteraceae bacterium]
MSEVVAQAEQAIRLGSKSFAAAARLFDRDTGQSAVMLYAWCRHCDDVVDGQTLGQGRNADSTPPEQRLARLEAETRRAFAGEPMTDPAFAALQQVARRHAIPERDALEHLAGFRMDVEGRRYETIEDTLDYCYHVAGVVGVMMAHIMGVRAPAVLDRACDLGIAFQLTNIARDVVEDAANGRVYLPDDWLAEAGIGSIGPDTGAALAPVVAQLLALAEPYYASAGIGIRALPPRCAWAIATARGVYREIGMEVLRRGPRAWDRRVPSSKLRKLALVLRGGIEALRRGRVPDIPRNGLWTRPD